MPAMQPASAVSDEALAEEARSGSLAAFTELLGRYESRLLRFLAQRLGSVSDAEDAFQEACLKAWRNMRLYDRRRRFSTWLFTLASHVAIDMLRRRGSIRPEPLGEGAVGRTTATDGPDNAGPGGLWALARRMLTGDSYAALWLYYAEDMSVRDIARALGRSSVWVKVSLFRSRRAIRDAIAVGGAADVGRPVRGGASC